MRYGKGILFPNFARVDRRLSEKTGFHFHGPYSWNSNFGKTTYYVMLFFFISVSLYITWL